MLDKPWYLLKRFQITAGVLVVLVVIGVSVPVLLSVIFPVLFVAAVVFAKGFVYISRDKVGIVTREYGRAHPDFRRITPHTTRGVLAQTLLPDRRRWLFPGLYTVRPVDRVYVPEGSIGMVMAKEGRRRPPGRTVALPVECDNFQDGQAFLLGGGEQGRQATTLSGGQWYSINTDLFEVTTVKRTYVPAGTIGLVRAREGGIRPPDRFFGPHVECSNFQDGAKFLAGGGEQGRQMAVLAGGAHYDINPALFDVTTVDNLGGDSPDAGGDEVTAEHLREISVPIGYTGVVTTLDGGAPASGDDELGPVVPGHQSFRLPWVFLERGGCRGVQAETLGEGTVYALNPWFVRVMLIPTRVLIMDWTEKSASQSRNFDADLEQIVVTVQGHRLHVEMSQTLQIPRESAPKLVRTFGGTQTSGIGGLEVDPLPVQRFVERVLGATVESYFNEIAAATSIADFLNTYSEIRTDLTAQVRNALLAWGVEAKRTTLGQFRAEDQGLNEALKEKFAAETRGEVLEVELTNERTRDEIDEIRVRSERRRAALELEAEIEALGRDNAAVIRIVREISGMQVPNYIGGGDISSYMEALPMTAVGKLMDQLRELHSDQQLDTSTSRLRLSKGESPEAEA
ncbi:SPFH domain-containing protein [Streptomyces sp. ODS28]|uniref:SPFH domain-containing protein n=1 Tax=Streptomyces sp. ODS28 TaxID=3136688 RepID=UPI0031EE47B1